VTRYSMRWCDKCKRWVAYYDESTVVRCPYCDNDLTIEKPPEVSRMQIEGWCYQHNCPLHFIPTNGIWQYLCPECVKETKEYYPTNITISTGKTPIRDMMVNGVPEQERDVIK